MVKTSLIASIVIAGSAFAVSNDEILRIVKSGTVTDNEMTTIFHSHDFNPYRMIGRDTILKLAKEHENKKMVDILEKLQGKSDKIESENFESNDKKVKLDLNEYDINQLNLLIATNNEIELANYLKKHSKDKNFNIDGVDLNGITPLMMAIVTSDVNGRIPVIEMLLNYGANIDLATSKFDENTALLQSCAQNSAVDIVYLLSRGAKLNITNKHGVDIVSMSQKPELNMCNGIINIIIDEYDRQRILK